MPTTKDEVAVGELQFPEGFAMRSGSLPNSHSALTMKEAQKVINRYHSDEKCTINSLAEEFGVGHTTISNLPVSYTHLTLPTKRIV